MRVYARNNTGSSSDVSATGSATVFENDWNHLVMTNDGTSLRVYVNRSSTADVTLALNGGASAYSDLSTQSLGVIDRSSDFGHFTGNIDEVAFYDTVLTSGEITSLAAGVNPIPEPSSLALLGLSGLLILRRKRN